MQFSPGALLGDILFVGACGLVLEGRQNPRKSTEAPTSKGVNRPVLRLPGYAWLVRPADCLFNYFLAV